MNIKDMVKDKKVSFLFYKEGELWYTTECGFEFPVPISDVGTASMNANDKAILFMRWIRKQIDEVKTNDIAKNIFEEKYRDEQKQLKHIAEMDAKGYTSQYCDY